MNIENLAKSLHDAMVNHKAIAPLSQEIGETDLELAYKIQQVNTERKLNEGFRIVGKKIGLTSKKVQQQFGIDQPDFGILFDDMEVLTGETLDINDFFNVRVEAELAFVLGQDLDLERMTIIDVLDSIDYVLPSIEIVDSRIENWNIKITDTIADNASASKFILGHTPKTLDEIDVIKCKMDLYKNGEIASTGTGEDCLGSPLNAVHWLANKMYEIGTPLEEGDVILSGSLGPMLKVEAGDRIIANFGELGEVKVNFN